MGVYGWACVQVPLSLTPLGVYGWAGALPHAWDRFPSLVAAQVAGLLIALQFGIWAAEVEECFAAPSGAREVLA